MEVIRELTIEEILVPIFQRLWRDTENAYNILEPRPGKRIRAMLLQLVPIILLILLFILYLSIYNRDNLWIWLSLPLFILTLILLFLGHLLWTDIPRLTQEGDP